jgi:hypothetical protein
MNKSKRLPKAVRISNDLANLCMDLVVFPLVKRCHKLERLLFINIRKVIFIYGQFAALLLQFSYLPFYFFESVIKLRLLFC